MARRLILLALGFLSAGASTAVSQGKDIVGYYLAMPGDYFACEAGVFTDSETFRLQAIQHKNIKNGYLLAHIDHGMRYSIEVALFKDRLRGWDVIAVSIDCGAGCMCNEFKLLAFATDGSWQILDDLLPVRQMEQAMKKLEQEVGAEISAVYKLPEFGTTIRTLDSASGALLYQLVWRNGAFHLQER